MSFKDESSSSKLLQEESKRIKSGKRHISWSTNWFFGCLLGGFLVDRYFSPNILLWTFSNIAEKLEELCGECPYTHELDSAINVLLYLFIT